MLAGVASNESFTPSDSTGPGRGSFGEPPLCCAMLATCMLVTFTGASGRGAAQSRTAQPHRSRGLLERSRHLVLARLCLKQLASSTQREGGAAARRNVGNATHQPRSGAHRQLLLGEGVHQTTDHHTVRTLCQHNFTSDHHFGGSFPSTSPGSRESPMVIRIPTAPASLATPFQAAHRISADFVAIVTVIAITPATPATRGCCLHCQ